MPDPTSLSHHVLNSLHESRFGVQRMKQLARTVCYWLSSDSAIVDLYRKWSKSAGHQTEPSKAAMHPWMLPETGSRLHTDHAVNFVDVNGWFYWRLYRIFLHSRKTVNVNETNDQARARRFRAFWFPPYGCNGLSCYVQVKRIPAIS